jgi:hypothetical protein
MRRRRAKLSTSGSGKPDCAGDAALFEVKLKAA